MATPWLGASPHLPHYLGMLHSQITYFSWEMDVKTPLAFPPSPGKPDCFLLPVCSWCILCRAGRMLSAQAGTFPPGPRRRRVHHSHHFDFTAIILFSEQQGKFFKIKTIWMIARMAPAIPATRRPPPCSHPSLKPGHGCSIPSSDALAAPKTIRAPQI